MRIVTAALLFGLLGAAPAAGAAPTPVAPAVPALFVTNGSGDSVTAYPLGTNGGVVPAARIAGADSGLSFPYGVAVDSSGNIYVTNDSGGFHAFGSVTVYRSGSGGNVVPSGTIIGADTGLSDPWGIALDAGGNIYVANSGGEPAGVYPSITVYAAGSNSDVKPIATITGANTGLARPLGIALDSGRNIYVANQRGGVLEEGSVTVYPAGSNGNVAPSVSISGPLIGDHTGLDSPAGIVVDSSGNLLVVNRNGGASRTGSVAIYPPGSHGNCPPGAIIAGANTGLYYPYGIALDSSGNIYVANSGPIGGADSITVYAAGSNGNVSPRATIAGAITGLNGVQGVAIGPLVP